MVVGSTGVPHLVPRVLWVAEMKPHIGPMGVLSGEPPSEQLEQDDAEAEHFTRRVVLASLLVNRTHVPRGAESAAGRAHTGHADCVGVDELGQSAVD